MAHKFEEAENKLRIKLTNLRIYESIATWKRRLNNDINSQEVMRIANNFFTFQFKAKKLFVGQ